MPPTLQQDLWIGQQSSKHMVCYEYLVSTALRRYVQSHHAVDPTRSSKLPSALESRLGPGPAQLSAQLFGNSYILRTPRRRTVRTACCLPRRGPCERARGAAGAAPAGAPRSRVATARARRATRAGGGAALCLRKRRSRDATARRNAAAASPPPATCQNSRRGAPSPCVPGLQPRRRSSPPPPRAAVASAALQPPLRTAHATMPAAHSGAPPARSRAVPPPSQRRPTRGPSSVQ